MNRYVYVFYRYRQRDMFEYSSFKDALRSFVYDFDYGEAWGVGIYDREAKILHMPDYFDKDEYNWAIKEMEKLGYEIEGIHFFDVPDWGR